MTADMTLDEAVTEARRLLASDLDHEWGWFTDIVPVLLDALRLPPEWTQILQPPTREEVEAE